MNDDLDRISSLHLSLVLIPKLVKHIVFDSDNIGAISDNVNLATVGTASEYIFGLGMFEIHLC